MTVHTFCDWVRHTCNNPGTGPITLDAPTGGYASLNECGVDSLVYYDLQFGNDRELGIGTLTALNTLARTTVLATLVSGVYDDVTPTAINVTGDAIVRMSAQSRMFKDVYDSCVKQYVSVAAMVADQTLEVGDVARTVAYYDAAAWRYGGAHYLIVAGGTGTDDGGLYHDLDNGLQARLVETRWDASMWGARGDDTSDDLARVQAAVNAIEAGSEEGGTLSFPPGQFRFSAPLRIKKGVRLVGAGLGGQQTTGFTAFEHGTEFLWTGTTWDGTPATFDGAMMIWFRGDDTNWCSGGGVEGIFLNGNTFGGVGIRLSGCMDVDIRRLIVRTFRHSGILLDSANYTGGAVPLDCKHNTIEDIYYVWGASTGNPEAASNAVHLQGGNHTTSTHDTAVNRNTVRKVSGRVYNGSGVYIGSGYENRVENVDIEVQSGGTGSVVRFDGANATSINHAVRTVRGKITASGGSSAIYGCRVDGHSTNGSGELVIANSAQVAIQSIDHVDGRVFRTPEYVTRERIAVPAAAFDIVKSSALPNVATQETTGFDWNAWRMNSADGVTFVSRIACSFPVPHRWSKGLIKQVDIRFATQSAVTGNATYRVNLSGLGQNGADTATPEYSDVHVFAKANGANRTERAVITLTTPLTVNELDTIVLYLSRGQLSDPLDAVPLLVLGADLYFESDGPTNAVGYDQVASFKGEPWIT